VGTALSSPARAKESRVAVALLVAIWLAFTFPAFTGKARFPVDFAGPAPGQEARPQANAELGDAFHAFYPWHSYLGDRLRDLELPLWDPYRFAGTAFSADIGTGTFYPPNWLYASGRVLATFTFIALASILASLLLAFWFLRTVRLHPYAAAVGAVVWTFSAFLMKWSTNEHVFGSAMWLPLALGGLEVARQGRFRRGVALATLGLALSLLAGHAQVALIVWLATGVWALVGLGFTAAGGPASVGAAGVGRQVAAAAAAFGLAGGIAAVQLLPTAQFTSLILRQETTFEAAGRTKLPPEHAPTLVLPDFRGSPLDGNYAGPGVNYTETAVYAGILTLPLAFLGLLNRPGRLAVFFALLAVIGLLAAFGTPFYRLILALPGFDRTLFVTRFILLVDVGLAGLAAVGLHSLLVEPTRRSVGLLVVPLAVVVAVVVLVVQRGSTPLPDDYITLRGVRAIAMVLLGGAVIAWMAFQPWRAPVAAIGVLAIITLDLWRFGFPYSPYQEPREVYVRTPAVQLLAAAPQPRARYANVSGYTIPPNGSLEYRIYGIEGYDPFVPKRIVELAALAEDQITKASFNFFGPFAPAAFQSPVMDLLGVRTAVAPPEPAFRAMGTVAGHAVLIDRPSAFPPAFLTTCWEQVDDRAVLDRLRSMSSAQLRATAIVSDGDTPAPGPGPCRNAGDAAIERYEPERVVARTRADTASVLVLSDAWFPGWSVTVDGEDAALLRVDHALRGVALPAGDHTVEFRFQPRALVAGGLVTAVSLLMLVALALASRWEDRVVE
jgi:hypothetical protein